MNCSGDHNWIKVLRSKNMYICTQCLETGWMISGEMFEEPDDV